MTFSSAHAYHAISQEVFSDLIEIGGRLCNCQIAALCIPVAGEKFQVLASHGSEEAQINSESWAALICENTPESFTELVPIPRSKPWKDLFGKKAREKLNFLASQAVRMPNGQFSARLVVLGNRSTGLDTQQKLGLDLLAKQISRELKKSLAARKSDLTRPLPGDVMTDQEINYVLQGLPIGVAINQISTGNALFMNDPFSEIYGWPKDTLTDIESFFEKVYPDPSFREKIRSRIMGDIQSGDIQRMVWNDVEVTTSDGEVRYVNAKNIPLTDYDLMISTVQDVTREHEARADLIEMNQRYEYATRATSGIVYDCDFGKKELLWGQNYITYFGEPGKAPTENYKRWEKRIHPDDRKVVLKSYEQALQSGDDRWSSEYRLKHETEDRYLLVFDRGYIHRDAEGAPLRMVGALQDITESSRNKQRLALFESAVRNTKDAILITKIIPDTQPEDHLIIYANKAFENLCGYSASELIGKTPRILYGPKTDDQIIVDAIDSLVPDKASNVEMVNYRKDGEEYFVDLTITPLYDSSGEKTHYISIHRESSLRHAENLNAQLTQKLAMIISESDDFMEMLHTITESIGTAMDAEVVELWMINPNKEQISRRASYVNPSVKAPSEKNAGPDSFVKSEGLPGIVWERQESLHLKNISEAHSGFVRNGLASKLNLFTGYGFPLISDKEVVGAVLILSSRRARSLGKLLESQVSGLDLYLGSEIARKRGGLELVSLINSVPDLICKVDAEGRFITVSKASRDILGYDPEELVGRNFTDFIHPEDRDISYSKLENLTSGQALQYLENRFFHKDGDVVWIAWTASPSDANGHHFSVGKNITGAKKRQKELRHLNKRLKIQNERLMQSNTELEHFAYVASHDLQEPLRMITGFLTQLEKKYREQLDERGQTYIHYAVDGAKRMRSIIHELLEYSRLGRQTGDMEDVDIREVLEAVVALFAPKIEAIGAQIIKPKKLPVIRSHRVLIFHVFQNLIDNALKYREENTEPVIQVRWWEEAAFWHFSIADNGIGIDSAYHEKIFGIFQRLHSGETYEGSGMGLSNTKKIVESLGGNISVESTPGEGSTFQFSLRKPVGVD